MRRRDDHLFQRLFAAQHMAQVERRMHAHGDLRVGHAQIGIEQHDLVATLGQGHGQVDRDGGLADPALATGNANHLRTQRVIHVPLLLWPTRGFGWPSCGVGFS